MRTPGDRGPRAVPAILVAVTTVVAMWMLRLAYGGGTGGGEAGIDGGVSVEFSHGHSVTDFDPLALLVGITLAAAAAGLWAARPAWALRAASTAALAALVTTVYLAIDRHDSGQITRDQLAGISIGMSHDAVRERLGTPAGEGTGTSALQQRLDCLVYFVRGAEFNPAFVCFDHGRVRYKGTQA